MNYKKVIDRILKNLDIDSENTKTLSTIRQDIVDTIKQVYAKSGYPNNSFCYKVGLEETILESFDDSTYIDNLTVSGDFILNETLERLELVAAQTGKVTITKLNKLCDIKFNAHITTMRAGQSIVTVKVYSQEGTLLDEESISILVTDTEYTFTPEVTGVQCESGWYVEIEGNPLLNDIAISNVSYTVNKREIKLPSDVFMVTGVTFSDEDKRFLRNTELAFPEYKSVRVVYQEPESDFPTPHEVMVSNAILYTLDYRTDGIYLIYKYEFEGLVDVVYTTLPSECFQDLDTVPVNESFMDLLVYGATIRGLRRHFFSVKDELEIVGLREMFYDYKRDYAKEIKRYAGFTQTTASGRTIKPFDYFQDNDMELD